MVEAESEEECQRLNQHVPKSGESLSALHITEQNTRILEPDELT